MKKFTACFFSGRCNAFFAMPVFVFYLFLSHPLQSRAQDSLHLFSVTYIKLKDPMYGKQYESLLNYYSKAIGEYGVKTGKIQGFYALKVIMPTGSLSDCDYKVVVVSNNLNILLDDTAAYLKKAVAGMTDEMAEGVNEQYNNIRTIVKKEIYNTVDWIDVSSSPKYVEIDYMKPADGKYSDYIKAERETWKPVHKERMKLGALSGWELDEKLMPASDKETYDVVTANFFDSLPMMLDAKYEQAFKSVWPQMDINKVGTEVGALRTMVKSDLLKVMFAVNASTMKQ
jgi:hypothetical protein